MPCLFRMTVGKKSSVLVLSSQALIEGKMRRQQSISSENAAQREAEREKLAAYMSRRLKL